MDGQTPEVKREGHTFFSLNESGYDLWFANVQPGFLSDGSRLSKEKLEQVATVLAASYDLLAACKAANQYLVDLAINGGPKDGMAGIVEWSTVQTHLSAAIACAEPTLPGANP